MTPTEAVERMLAPFSLSHMRNPALFVRMAVEALKNYSPEVLDQLGSPSTGPLTKSKFAPTIAEMISEAERLSRKGSKNFV
jgi:hypothetical protein